MISLIGLNSYDKRLVKVLLFKTTKSVYLIRGMKQMVGLAKGHSCYPMNSISRGNIPFSSSFSHNYQYVYNQGRYGVFDRFPAALTGRSRDFSKNSALYKDVVEVRSEHVKRLTNQCSGAEGDEFKKLLDNQPGHYVYPVDISKKAAEAGCRVLTGNDVPQLRTKIVSKEYVTKDYKPGKKYSHLEKGQRMTDDVTFCKKQECVDPSNLNPNFKGELEDGKVKRVFVANKSCEECLRTVERIYPDAEIVNRDLN